MEPIFDRSGQTVGWLRGEVVYDRGGRPAAFLRNRRLITYAGAVRGHYREGFFTDPLGGAVAYLQGAEGGPPTPIPDVAQDPPPPGMAPQVEVFASPPPPTQPTQDWSDTDWETLIQDEPVEDPIVVSATFQQEDQQREAVHGLIIAGFDRRALTTSHDNANDSFRLDVRGQNREELNQALNMLLASGAGRVWSTI